MRRTRLGVTATLLVAACLVAGGCGDDGTGSAGTQDGEDIGQATDAHFPRPSGRSMRVLIEGMNQGPELAPAAFVFEPGRNRFPFALFDRGNRQIGGLDVRVYVSRGLDETARGPYAARYHAIEVKPQFRSQNSVEDPDSARSIYVAETPLSSRGNHVVAAVARLNGRLVAGITQVMVESSDIPGPGDRAIRVHTPTVSSAGGNIKDIETRVPPDTMHEVDLADALDRRRPAVLLFATPALCESRICGPVTDVTEQVKSEFDGDAEFIHMEIYNDNNLKKGARPQFRAWHLSQEPVLFTIGRDGRVVDRIQGAFSVDELRAAVRRAIR
ncbi:MAG TPA: hypothetical protein VFB51_15740 [Solirubrobacterales bacterium]|nr:hypothetical protein [Solirubrobacterales bacterium]